MTDGCPLCRVDVSETAYWDPFCFVMAGRDFGRPLLVLRRHAAEPSAAETTHMERVRIRRFGPLTLGQGQRGGCDGHWHRFLEGDWQPLVCSSPGMGFDAEYARNRRLRI